MSTDRIRTPWQITRHVWHALLLREVLARITADRMAWLWLMLEPVAHVTILLWVRSLLGRIRVVTGADYTVWLILGILGFLMFRNTMNRGMEAINANRALFAYRYVQPADTVLVRCALEFVLGSTVMMLMIAVLVLLEFPALPSDPLRLAGLWTLLWLLGTGVALMCSVVTVLLPESARFIRMLIFPLYFLSGVIMPVQFFPHELQQVLLWNPLLHAMELLRGAFFSGYRPVVGVDGLFVAGWVVGALFLGLLFHLKFKTRLLAQ